MLELISTQMVLGFVSGVALLALRHTFLQSLAWASEEPDPDDDNFRD